MASPIRFSRTPLSLRRIRASGAHTAVRLIVPQAAPKASLKKDGSRQSILGWVRSSHTRRSFVFCIQGDNAEPKDSFYAAELETNFSQREKFN